MRNLLLTLMLTACAEPREPTDKEVHWLCGNWTSPAFDGRIDEYWESDGRRVFLRKGYYIEDGDTSYSEEVRIDTLGGTIYLAAKPFDSPLRVYTLTGNSGEEMIFENLAYRNPFEIRYRYLDRDHFTRAITGVEGEDTVQAVFQFVRVR